MKTSQTVYVHPSSSLFNQTPPVKAVLYYELVQTSKSYMRQIMEIKPAWLLEGESVSLQIAASDVADLWLQSPRITSSPRIWSSSPLATRRCRRR